MGKFNFLARVRDPKHVEGEKSNPRSKTEKQGGVFLLTGSNPESNTNPNPNRVK